MARGEQANQQRKQNGNGKIQTKHNKKNKPKCVQISTVT
jgi:hypothetical protein